jgi:hypothetical protein
MSWSLNLVGTRSAVKAAVQKAGNEVPDGVKKAIVEVCDDPNPGNNAGNGILVKGHGHNNTGNSYRSSIGMLTVEPVDVLTDPPAAVDVVADPPPAQES